MERKETVEKLNFMADWLDNMHITHPALKFNYNVLVAGEPATNAGGHACGTVGCAVGNMPWMWPNEAALASAPGDWGMYAKSRYYLDIDHAEWDRLFQPGYLPKESGLAANASASKVAAHIRRCAEAIGEGVDITEDEFREELSKLEGYEFIDEDEDEDY